RVKEPTVRFFDGPDFDHAAGLPVGFAELSQLVDPIDHPAQDFAIPATRFAGPADAVLSVPAAAVDFPRHFCGLADLIDFEVALPPSGSGGKVVRLSLDIRARGKNRSECFGGVRARSSRSRDAEPAASGGAKRFRLRTSDVRIPSPDPRLKTPDDFLRR